MKVFFSSSCSRSHSARSSRRSLASRLDSGSSSRKVDGFVTRVRASATRCDSPPEQAPGNLSSRSVSRTIAATSRTRRARSSRGTFFMRSPNSMFCATVLCGNSAWRLEHHAEAAVARLEIVDDPAVDADLAAVRLLEPGDQAQRRGLAAARRPDEHDELAVLDRAAQIAHRDERAVGLDQIDQLDPRHAYLRTMPKLKPRARCLRIRRPTIDQRQR